MDKKKLLKDIEAEDLKGFEEFIEGQPQENTFLPKGVGGGIKKDNTFEHLTFLTHDSNRLMKIKNLLCDKLPFSAKYEQGKKIIEEQNAELTLLREKLFNISDREGSPYRKTLEEIFDSFFGPPRS